MGKQFTGSHVHLCEGRFGFVLQVWEKLGFRGSRVGQVGEVDSPLIPDNTPHREIGTSDEFALLKISFPADMGAKICETPEIRLIHYRMLCPCGVATGGSGGVCAPARASPRRPCGRDQLSCC